MLNLSCCRFGGHLLIVPVASIGQAGAREEPSIPLGVNQHRSFAPHLNGGKRMILDRICRLGGVTIGADRDPTNSRIQTGKSEGYGVSE